jgi:beta-galactosidase
MELDVGQGRVVLCTLDVEDHAALDPAAHKVASQIVEYALACPLAPRAKSVVYVGGDAGAATLDMLGVSHTRAPRIGGSADLLVVGPDATLDGLEEYVRGGDKAFVMPRAGEATAFGARLEQRDAFAGSLDAPAWPEARGLSASDLRRRTDGATRVLTGGKAVEVGADGLLGRVAAGRVRLRRSSRISARRSLPTGASSIPSRRRCTALASRERGRRRSLSMWASLRNRERFRTAA